MRGAGVWLLLVALSAGAQTDVEGRASAARDAGRLREAFDLYLEALRTLPEDGADEADLRMRGAVIEIVPQLDPPPERPAEVERLSAFGKIAFTEAADVPAYERAAKYFRKAARLAPWASEIVYNLHLVEKRLGNDALAVANLRLYLATKPEDASGAQATLSVLEHFLDKESAKPYVYFFRAPSSDPTYKKKSFEIVVDGKPIARLGDGRYFAARLPPGSHTWDARYRVMGIKTPAMEFSFDVQRSGTTWVLIPFGVDDIPSITRDYVAALKRCKPIDKRDVIDRSRVVEP